MEYVNTYIGRDVKGLAQVGKQLYPIEIKKSKQPDSPDKNFEVLKQLKMDVRPGVVLCMSDELIPYNRETWYCPVSVL